DSARVVDAGATGGARDVARFADGAPRSPRARQGHRAGCGRHRAAVLSRALGGGCAYGGDELAAVLQRLVDAGLVYRSGRPREEMYSFKHALLRDVAYENLLRARRQQLHERIGRVLVENFASIAESEPELVAHHFQYAGLHDLACTYRELAGDRAAARSSFAEAIAHFHAALAEAELLAEGQDRMRRELSVLIKMGPPLG